MGGWERRQQQLFALLCHHVAAHGTKEASRFPENLLHVVNTQLSRIAFRVVRETDLAHDLLL
jgi:hypothetical protein